MFRANARHIRVATLTMGAMMTYMLPIHAQQAETPSQSAGMVAVSAQTMERLQQHLAQLEAEVTDLKAQMKEVRSAAAPAPLTAGGSSAVLAHSTVDGEGESGALSGTAQAAQESALLSAEDR